jgi:uncharacterized membrane protein YdjX (TVP38/TMEM64 family)
VTAHRTLQRVVLLVLLCAVLALLASSDDLYSALVGVLDAAAKLIDERPVVGAVLFVVLSGLSAMLAFFSSSVLVPVALYAWGKVACMLLLWVGWMLGGAATYGIGRYLGRPVVEALLPAGTLERYERRIPERPPFGFLVLLQLAMPSEVPGYLLGLLRVPFRRYLAALVLAEAPYAVGTVFLGSSFLDRRLPLLIGLGAAGALLMAVSIRALHRRLAE